MGEKYKPGVHYGIDVVDELSKILSQEIDKAIVNQMIEDHNKIQEEKRVEKVEKRNNKIDSIIDDKDKEI